ncbi:class I SAM-dependent methyltransferase [Undibacterium sp. TS12]|uniref:class I SAM-dependent methyltransferase n=1 Tax=Undibacterium sp. TS12 TaxID=2908202 RepID=UPI001F4C84E9|nr:class I SAM-dependent methyltransferase [Undibacterium sp. TS12]MCH8619234.1 class I SAM-dependent methyltransferase [Undibacterium sp. TS12]
MKTDQASNTALIVAAGVQVLAQDTRYRDLLPKAMARQGQRLLETSHPRLHGMLAQGWFRGLCHLLQGCTLPGILPHYVLRKTVIREYVTESISNGIRQIVVLGAGYDTLCAELAGQHDDLTLIELDHPATQAIKRQAGPACGIHYIAADLATHDLTLALLNCPFFNPAHPSLFIAEGLLMYLDIRHIQTLLRQIQNAVNQATLIFTWMEIQSDGRPNFRPASKLVDFLLRKKHEPFLSGMAQAEVADFLDVNGFQLQSLRESHSAKLQGQVTERLKQQAKPIAGEYICLARSHRQIDGPI